MKLWPVEHFWAHFSSVLGGFAVAGATANPLKTDDKYAVNCVQLVRVSSFQSDFLQNPYFSKPFVEQDVPGINNSDVGFKAFIVLLATLTCTIYTYNLHIFRFLLSQKYVIIMLLFWSYILFQKWTFHPMP